MHTPVSRNPTPSPGGRFRYIIDIVVAVHGVPFSRTTGTGGGREAEETTSGEGHQIAGALLLPLASAHQLGADLHQLDGGTVGLLDDNRESSGKKRNTKKKRVSADGAVRQQPGHCIFA